MNRKTLIWVVALVALFAAPAFAWGPATHSLFSTLILDGAIVLPAAVLSILRRKRRDFIYGSIAPDEILAKNVCHQRFHCHNWDVGFRLLEESRTESQRAFSCGYLSHLAADVVAHNGYVPERLRRSRTTLQFGHTYWEVRADRLVDPAYLALAVHVRKDADQERNQALMERVVLETVFSHRTNRRICDGMYRISNGRSWSRVWDFIDRYSRWDLPEDAVRRFHVESLEAIHDVLANGRQADIVREDPIGALSLRLAVKERRRDLRLRRAEAVHDALPEGARRWLEARRRA